MTAKSASVMHARDLKKISGRQKGLRILGTSRSGRKDFEGLVNLYASRPDVVGYLEKMVGAVVPIRDVKDMVTAFETDIHKDMGKTIMVWD